MLFKRILFITVLSAFAAVACAPQSGASTATAPSATAQAPTDKPAPTDAPMQDPTAMPAPTDASMTDPTAMPAPSDTPEPVVTGPAWMNTTLTNVRTGETFQIADFRGKVVLVETLAVWCSNCRSQQRQVASLHSLLGERDDFVSVGLDIDINENDQLLKEHTERHGFDWVYAVAPAAVVREIGELYGQEFLNPPSTPMMIIDRAGEAHTLPFGIKDAGSLQSALQPYLDAP